MLEEFLKDYLIECNEAIETFEAQLLELEKSPDSKPLLASIFRAVHSIKGASGFLGFAKMAGVTHEGEELLGRLRDGRVASSPEIVSALLSLIDAMRTILRSIETDRTEGDHDHSSLVKRLQALQSGEVAPVAVTILDPVSQTIPLPAATDRKKKIRKLDAAKQLPPPRAEVAAAVEPSPTLADATIRVDTALLDTMMNLVGELVLTRNQLLRAASTRDEATLQASTQRLNVITTELQEGMMRTRMQPIRTITAKLPRVVRDLAEACGKRATIVMEGEDAELDRTLSEAIKDPIMHIIRNAVDHGIEPPEIRLARGKPAEGAVRLRAYHEGGMVHVEIADDGAGIDPERIRRKALERGWLDAEAAAKSTDRDLIALIFRPGFSTAESTTMVSGRGVGMDVVKSRVESIGGSVEAGSVVGVGTSIKLKIPLTLTIVNALIIGAGDERFAIPQVSLVELLRLKGDAAATGVLDVQGALACRYRGRLLPLVDLDQVLKINPAQARSASDSVNIVVLSADDHRFGLIVDRIDDAQEIVVRPLARQLRGISCLAGATIMGDGKIALILDVFGLARGLDGRHGRSVPAPGSHVANEPATATTLSLVVLRDCDGAQVAIPLDQVERLESVAESAAEWVGDRSHFQYRGSLVPLFDLAAMRGSNRVSEGPARFEGGWQVVLHVRDGRRVGLVFDRVLDIVDHPLPSAPGAMRPTKAILLGRATEIVDLASLAFEEGAER